MKTILYDLTCTQPLSSKFHGVGLYAETVFLALCEKANNIELKALFSSKDYLNPIILEKCKLNNIELIDLRKNSYKEVVNRVSPDIYFTALPSKNRILHIPGVKFLTVCHDIRTIDTYFDPFYYKFCQNWRDFIFILDNIFLGGYIAKKNTLTNIKMFIGHENTNFITVSRHTKYHVLSVFPNLKQKDIPVFYSPMLEQVFSGNISFNNLPLELTKKKYFLMDSGWRWMKNNLRAAIAIDQVFTDKPNLDFKAVIVGVKSQKPYLSKLKNKDKFVLLDYVDREVLNTLHRDAYCFIYPSLAEGFGYSPLESMKYEVPVIASSVSSIPEICGDAVLYANPNSIPEIKNRCLQILDNQIYDEIKNKCLNHYNEIGNKQKNDLNQLIQYMIAL